MYRKHLLIVDDNQDILFVLKLVIKQLWPHLQVLTADNGFMALEYLHQTPIDLLLTNYKMPGINGLELASAARQIAPELYIVMMSANAPAELRGGMIYPSLDEYIDKPFGLAEIRRFVDAGCSD